MQDQHYAGTLNRLQSGLASKYPHLPQQYKGKGGQVNDVDLDIYFVGL